MAGPLDGTLVLDLSRVLAGPWASQALADLGARVIKVGVPPKKLGLQTQPAFWSYSANRGMRQVRIDLKAPEGKAAFIAALESQQREGAAKFVLDFREVPYMDSPTIGETVACLKRVNQEGGQLKVLLSKDTKTYEIFRLTSLDKIVEMKMELWDEVLTRAGDHIEQLTTEPLVAC